MNYKGVLIEESLDDTSILSKITIVSTKTTALEGEENRGEFHFNNVEVSENVLNEVLDFISAHIQDGWYFHLVKDDEIIVVFHNKVMKAHKGNTDKIEKIKEYGISQGILKEQLEIESLIDNPWD